MYTDRQYMDALASTYSKQRKIPEGYVWARELDPNAVYQGGVLKALGRTYKPGEFYMEGGRAYIPNPVPEGAQWIRSYFPGGAGFL